MRPAIPASFAAAALLLAGCATTPALNPVVEQARSEYNSAAADPNVARHAPLELRAASEALQRLENAAADSAPPDLLAHRAHLAQRQVEIARASAQLRAAEQAVETARMERDRIQLAARTREAEQAQTQARRQSEMAEQAQREAQTARAEAQRRAQAAQQAQTRAEALEQRLKELQATRSDRGLVLTLGDVVFDTGSATLNPGGLRRIDQLADALRDFPDASIRIEGFTDSRGDEAYNQRLSEARANAVRQALAQRGIDPSRVMAAGYGESAPVASNDTPAGRQMNRRVEIVIAGAGAQASLR